MKDSRVYCIQFFYVLFVFVICQAYNVRCDEVHSVFSFIHTDNKSPTHIEDTCLVIENSKLYSKYLGLQTFITKSSKYDSCKPENIELKEFRKTIVDAKRDRRLCRTKLTVFINNINCEKAIDDLKTVCHGKNSEKTSIFFQECEEIHFYDEAATTNETMTISMSEFLTPTIGIYGPIYEIPKVQCNSKQHKSDRRTTNRSRVTPFDVKYSSNILAFKVYGNNNQIKQVHPEQSYSLFAVVGSGVAGLVVGVMTTSLICILVPKNCEKKRIKSDVIFPKSSLNRMSGGDDDNISIYFQDERDTYHYIADTPAQSDVKGGHELSYVSNTVDDVLDQRYHESPRNSTSSNENERSHHHQSTEQPSDSIQWSQMYHTLSKTFSIGSKQQDRKSATKSLYSQNNMRYRACPPMSGIKNEQPNCYYTLSPEKCLSAEMCLDFDRECSQNAEEGVYQVLKENEERYSETPFLDTPKEMYLNTRRNGK